MQHKIPAITQAPKAQQTLWHTAMLFGGALALLLSASTLLAQSYTATNRSIVSGGATRSFVQAVPAITSGKPLVIALHGDGGNGAGLRSSIGMEAAAAGVAVFVYPNAPGGTFAYFSSAGRTAEVQFIRDLINQLQLDLGIDRTRVFLSGFSGGGTMANALACRMGAAEIRGVAVNAGSLYPIDGDFSYTANGGVSCIMPATMLLWGESDGTPGVSFATGQSVRNNITATNGCSPGSSAFSPSPCVSYSGCTRPVAWCAIPAMGHSIWSQSGLASWNFFSALGSAQPPVSTQDIYADAVQNGWQNFSWGTVNFADAASPHSGTQAIRFTAHSFQGLSFARPSTPIVAAQFPVLRFYIRGTQGGENFNISLQSGATLHANVPLASFITGGAVVAGQYREVIVPLTQPPISYTGSFERINVQDNTGNAAASAQVVLIDSVLLQDAGGATQLLRDGFETPQAAKVHF